MTELIRIVGIRFKRAGKVYYFDPDDLELDQGDQVIVETATGLAFGDVVVAPKDVPEQDVVLPIRKVLRKVGRDDHERLVLNRDDERLAHDIALERIEAHGLPMRLVNAEYTFDRTRLTFFFTADNRVDFRALVHDLAKRFGVRIELRQIGVRDEAKEVGGIGVCGRELCCTSWMGEFAPVSIRMAKQQNLSLNPTKLTGQCGRLKCCLKFENDTYREVRALLPQPGDAVAVSVPVAVLGGEEAVGATARGALRAAAGAETAALAGRRSGSLLESVEPSNVVVQGKVREVLVTRESVAVDIGGGRQVNVSLRQIESGEAVVLSGKLAKNGRTETASSPEIAAVSELNGRDGEQVTPEARSEAGSEAQSESQADAVQSGAQGAAADAADDAKGGDGPRQDTANRPPRRRRRPARRRPRRRPDTGQ